MYRFRRHLSITALILALCFVPGAIPAYLGLVMKRMGIAPRIHVWAPSLALLVLMPSSGLG